MRGQLVLTGEAKRFENAVTRLDHEKSRFFGVFVTDHREQRKTPHRAIDSRTKRLGELHRDAIGALTQKNITHRARKG